MKSNKIQIWTILGAAALLFTAPSLVRAEDEASIGGKAFSIGGRGSYIIPKDADKDDGTWQGGAQVRLKILPAMAIEGSADYRRSKFGNGTTTVHTFPVQASLLAYLTPQYRVSPFLLGGAGWYFTRVEGPGNFEETKNRFGTHAGGGLEFKLNEYLSVDASYRYIWVEDIRSRDQTNVLEKDYEDNAHMITAGLNFHFF